MRWSLIVSISATLLSLLAFSAYGLTIPSQAEGDLLPRATKPKPASLTQGSAKDRQASGFHGHTYDIQKDKGMKKWQAGEYSVLIPVMGFQPI